MALYRKIALIMACALLMHWTRVVWVSSKLELTKRLSDLTMNYIGALDAVFLIFFAYGILFTSKRLFNFSHRTVMLVITLIIQAILLIFLALILLSNLSAISIIPFIFMLLPITQAVSYCIILINIQIFFDESKSLTFTNVLTSLWHSSASFGHILGFSFGILLSRGVFQLDWLEKYSIPILLNATFFFVFAIILAFFFREKTIKIYAPPSEVSINSNNININNINNNNVNNIFLSKTSSVLSLSPTISGLISLESNNKDKEILETSNYSRFSRESSKQPIFFQKNLKKSETFWILKEILVNSLSFAGIKTLYWGILFWGAVFLNRNNPEGEVWLGNMSMILYESGQIVMAFLLSLKKLEYKRILFIYPIALLFAIVGLLFLFIANPTHMVYYIVFLILGGFLALIYMTIGDVICEGMINDADLTVSFEAIKKTGLGIDIFGNFLTGLIVFLISFILDWLMILLCIISAALLIYWLYICYKEYNRKDRLSDATYNLNHSLN